MTDQMMRKTNTGDKLSYRMSSVDELFEYCAVGLWKGEAVQHVDWHPAPFIGCFGTGVPESSRRQYVMSL